MILHIATFRWKDDDYAVAADYLGWMLAERSAAQLPLSSGSLT